MDDKPQVGIIYKLANGKQVCIDVSIEVKELLEQTDRQTSSQRRQDRRHLDYVGSIDGLENVQMPPQEDIADIVNRMDDCKRLYAAIGKLPELQRRRLLLYFFEELNFRQIAELEGVGISAVVRSIKRGLDSLSKILK